MLKENLSMSNDFNDFEDSLILEDELDNFMTLFDIFCNIHAQIPKAEGLCGDIIILRGG
jgi:hypothetical protein